MMKVSVSNPRILAGAEVEVEGEPVEMGYAASLARAETLDKELAIPYSTEVWGWDKINGIVTVSVTPVSHPVAKSSIDSFSHGSG